jgi:signal transduction histidine kinase
MMLNRHGGDQINRPVGLFAATLSQPDADALRRVDGNSDAAQDEVPGIARTLAAAPSSCRALRARPDLGAPAARGAGPAGHRHRLRRGHDARRHPALHPDPAQIGGRFRGTIAPAVAGGTVVETFTGTLGPSVRAVVPVVVAGRVAGLVAVGRTINHVSAEMTRQLPLLAGTTAAALLVAGAGSWLASRWLRRSTHDLGPAELSRMYEYYDAVPCGPRRPAAARPGRPVAAGQRRGPASARAARRRGRPRRRARPRPRSGRPRGRRGARRQIFDRRPGRRGQPGHRPLGRAAPGHRRHIARPHELRSLVSELKTIRGFAEALSAQAHESANQLQTVISLIELGRPDEALRFAATELAVAQHLTDIVVGAVGEPELAALVLGKAAEASERGVELRVDDDLEVPAGVADPRDLVTIVGNLLDNAVDAATEAPAPRWVRLEAGVLTVDGWRS